MRKLLIAVLVIVVPIGAAGLSAVMGASAQTPEQPPTLMSIEEYAVHETSRVVNGTQQDVKNWLEEVKLVSFMEATSGIPSVVSTTPISGDWGENGATRYANLDNGHTAIDRIIENRDPELFHYQVFGFTAPTRFIVNHIMGRIEYAPVSDEQTRITWSYAIYPTSWATRPIANNFLTNRIVPFMENTMDNMAEAVPQ